MFPSFVKDKGRSLSADKTMNFLPTGSLTVFTMYNQLPILFITFQNSQDKLTSTSSKVGTFVSGTLIIRRTYSGILTRNILAFSGILDQSLGFSGLLEMGLSGFGFPGNFVSGSLIFTRKFSGKLMGWG